MNTAIHNIEQSKSNKENIKKNSKFEVGGHVRISKCEKHFCKMLHSKLV